MQRFSQMKSLQKFASARARFQTRYNWERRAALSASHARPTLGCIGQLAVTGRLMAVAASKARQAEASTRWTDWEPASGQHQASGQVCRIQWPDR